jgi:hypothetical protein
MRSVTGRAIAYTAVQVSNPLLGYTQEWRLDTFTQLRFSLSSANSWNLNDGCFSYPVFYNNIVDFFENTPGPVAQAEVRSLLSWWTLCVNSNADVTLTQNIPEKLLEAINSHRKVIPW